MRHFRAKVIAGNLGIARQLQHGSISLILAATFVTRILAPVKCALSKEQKRLPNIVIILADEKYESRTR